MKSERQIHRIGVMRKQERKKIWRENTYILNIFKIICFNGLTCARWTSPRDSSVSWASKLGIFSIDPSSRDTLRRVASEDVTSELVSAPDREHSSTMVSLLKVYLTVARHCFFLHIQALMVYTIIQKTLLRRVSTETVTFELVSQA